MIITVGGKVAALKKGTSIEYVAENRSFGGSDGYTLSVTFPLKGCPQNLEIFGHINRDDVVAERVVFDAELRDGAFVRYGCFVVNEISEVEVKTQFLDGRSELNFDRTFADIYVNELAVAQWPETMPTPVNVWSFVADKNCVALPWVSDISGNIQNCADYADGSYKWNKYTRELSWQPNLLWLTKKICEAVRYTFDFAPWEQHPGFSKLIVCNTLPAAWAVREFARALPHWSVEEYFEKLELFLNAEFDIDHRAKHIGFAFTTPRVEALPLVELSDIVAEHSQEVSTDSDDADCDYIDACNIIYKECDHAMWKYYSCDWYIRTPPFCMKRYATLAALVADAKGWAKHERTFSRNALGNYLLYAEDEDRYFLLRCIRKELIEERPEPFQNRYYNICILQPVNAFGGRIVDDSADADSTEIEFVPVRIDETDEVYGPAMFLSMNGFDEEESASVSPSRGEIDPSTRPGNMGFPTGSVSGTVGFPTKEEKDAAIPQGWAEQILADGEQEKRSEYYDRIFVAWYDGTWTRPLQARPHVDPIEFSAAWGIVRNQSPLRLSGRTSARKALYDIDPKRRVTFKFLADKMPDTRSLFLIRNKRYVCKKLTATFTENGMSRLIKGEFHPLR